MNSDSLIHLLKQDARYTHEQLAQIAGLDVEAVKFQLSIWEKSGVILGYQAVIDEQKLGDDGVSAFIEVKLTPERDGGFDKLAMRIAKFSQVTSCYLASGGYDLMVVIEGTSLHEVSRFVTEKLSTMHGVVSTATHFKLKTYKESGCVFESEQTEGRLPITP